MKKTLSFYIRLTFPRAFSFYFIFPIVRMLTSIRGPPSAQGNRKGLRLETDRHLPKHPIRDPVSNALSFPAEDRVLDRPPFYRTLPRKKDPIDRSGAVNGWLKAGKARPFRLSHQPSSPSIDFQDPFFQVFDWGAVLCARRRGRTG